MCHCVLRTAEDTVVILLFDTTEKLFYSVRRHAFECTLVIPLFNTRGFLTRRVYLYYKSYLRYTILVGNPRYDDGKLPISAKSNIIFATTLSSQFSQALLGRVPRQALLGRVPRQATSWRIAGFLLKAPQNLPQVSNLSTGLRLDIILIVLDV